MAQASADPNQGPGGPVLVITSPSSTFGRFYAEILRTEGLNAFAVADMSTVSASTLTAYDTVVLSKMTLTGGQVTTLTDWVNAGGNLIAMDPDAQLAPLLGLNAPGSTLADRYLLVDTSTAIGNGIVNQTIQYHGSATLYTLNGAQSLATLYSNSTTATPNPAVTLRSVGANGGQAAMFAYDLATSIVYTRQGNPAWVSQERDGLSPLRSDDLFFGDSAADPQANYVDLSKVAIPQADEQQRLLANLITSMTLDRKPLPRFWYFPNGYKAVVIMTGDDHGTYFGGGGGATADRFEQFELASTPGCDVANWECIRGTSYVFTTSTLTPQLAQTYNGLGYEVGLHINTGLGPNNDCLNFTPASLAQTYQTQKADFAARFPGLAAPITQRHHCIVWSDWATGAKTMFANGMRLDTNYYYWPATWVGNVPGNFTGSAMPMRFADLDGTLIDVFQAVTQMTDESGQSYPFTVTTLLDRAVGPEEQYGAYTVNAHTDFGTSVAASTTVAAAQARGVPVVAARQMLTWLDGRNASTFGTMSWSGTQLSFSVTQGTGATGLRGMIPRRSANGTLSTITRNAASVTFTTQIIKGIDYAVFPAAAGNYVATYILDTTPPTITARTPASGATDVPAQTSVTATFSEAMNPATINTSTIELRNGAVLIPATVSFSASTNTATLTPTSALAVSTTYTVTVLGGATDPRVKDSAGNALAANSSWSFTTWASPTCNPCTLWNTSTQPTNPAQNDPNPVELGVRFRSDANGWVTGVRFYKGSTNTGTHIGNLWSATGERLGTATFSGESASGWQEVSFATPVPITANTVYTASYFASQGNYAVDYDYFATSGVDGLVLHGLRDGDFGGGNGVYAYNATSAFPSSSYRSSNYWVDVVFTTTAPVPDTTPPTVTSTLPTAASTGVGVSAPITATFSEAMTAATIDSTTFVLRNPSNAIVPATVTYDGSSRTATLTPSAALAATTTYTATIAGGGLDPRVKDAAGNALAANYVFSFTTGVPPACPCFNVWSSAPTPASIQDDEALSVELGVKFRVDVAGYIMAVRFYKGPANTGTHVGSLWSATGTLLGRVTFENETASGWQEAALPTPVAVAPNTTYVVSYFAPNGRYASDVGYFTGTGVDNGLLHAPSHAASGGNGVFAYGSSPSFPSNAVGSNYWADISFAPGAPDTTPPTVQITSPTTNTSFATGTSPFTIGGTAADTYGVTQVTWTNDQGGSGTATGTTSWSVTGIALQPGANLITVTARDAANNPSTATLTINYTPPDTTSPVATITSPTNVATFNTSTSPMSIGGTASDNTAVTQVAWTNSVGGSGTATGTTTWAASGIVLQSGVNTITVTARDAAGNIGTDVLAVNYTPPADTTPPTVTLISPTIGATGVSTSTAVSIVFNESMTASTINTSTVELRNPSNQLVSASVSYNVANFTATLTPSSQLASQTTYTATVRGGTTDPRVKDVAGNALLNNFAWSFTTGNAGDPCTANAIAAENCLPGNPGSEWDVSGVGDPSIQGFATNISVNRGSTIQFKVDTTAAAYRFDIYRMGYYGGLGARKVATVNPSASLPQIQPGCIVQSSTGLIDCGNWAVSGSWAVPSTAVSGIYFAKVVRTDNGGASHIVFIVRNDSSTSDMVFQTSDTTWHAYNNYGGNSLYQGSPGTNPGRAYKVSYNRPFNTRIVDGGQDWVFNAEYPMVRWLEANGYDISYISGVDTDRAGNLLTNHRVFLSVGHDEYWSAQQRTNVESARDAGLNLAFFSGNEVFWKTRYEASIDGSSTAYRTLVSYKETHADAKIDPNAAWTGTWRDTRFSPPGDARPENSLTGTWFRVNAGTSGISVPAALGKLRLWRGTTVAELAANETADLPDGTLGYEWDEVPDNGFAPAGVFKLSDTTVQNVQVLQDLGSTYGNGTARHALTLYKHSSGARVFGAGTVQWSWGLDSDHDRAGTPSDDRMKQATVNLFADMNVQPGTLQAGLVAATPSTDGVVPTSVISQPTAGANIQISQVFTISGTAADSAGGVVAGVEVSTDNGTTWHAATGRETWSYAWTPTALGSVTIRVRAIDDSGNIQTSPASVTVEVAVTAPQNCPCSIWSVADEPGTIEDPEALSLQLGVKFRSDLAGRITGIRFYKGPNNSGTHVGSLWTTTGTLLASAPFTGETASGWQQVTFATPVDILANTTYVAAYHAPNGRYSADSGYFAGGGTDNGVLHALSDSAAGGNGVYAVGSANSFPNQTFGASNYWVDVVFTTVGGSSETTPPSVAITTPTANTTHSTTTSTLTLGGTASDNVGVTQVTWSNDRGGSGTATGTTSWSVPDITLQTGQNVLTVTARDAAGNTNSGQLTVTYTVAPDTTLPVVTITSPTSNATLSTTSTPLSIGGTASDNIGVTLVTWANDRGGSGNSSGTTTNWTVSGIVLQTGVNVITVTARDAAGNTRDATLTVTYTLPDTTNPTAAFTAPTNGTTFSTSATTTNVGGTGSDNVGVTQVSWNNSLTGGSGTATGTASWTANDIALNVGLNTITVTARDAVGNQGTDTLAVTRTAVPDTTQPNVQITSPTSNSTVTVTNSPMTLGGTASDNVAVTQVSWTNSRGGAGTATGTTSWSAPDVNLQSGSNTLTVTASDAAGNTRTGTLTVTFNPPANFGLVAAYAFQEGTGVTLGDASGNNNLGTASNTSWTNSGRFGRALTFNGTSSRVFVNSSSSLNLSSGMTLMAWVYPTSNQTGNRTIIRREGDAYWLTSSRTGNNMRPGGGATINGSTVSVGTTSVTLSRNTWSHVAITYDGGFVRLYVNGTERASGNATGSIASSSNPLWIGATNPNGQNFAGRIDEVRVYNRALSQTEVNTIRNTAIN